MPESAAQALFFIAESLRMPPPVGRGQDFHAVSPLPFSLRQPIQMLENDNYNDWRIGLIPHIPGFPLPVVGLVAPDARWQGLVSLHISRDVALHLGAAEVVIQETTFPEFQRLSAETAVGKTVAAVLGADGMVNPFDFVAVTSYCVSKGISAEPDVERAARLIREAYRELARQILAQNQARFN